MSCIYTKVLLSSKPLSIKKKIHAKLKMTWCNLEYKNNRTKLIYTIFSCEITLKLILISQFSVVITIYKVKFLKIMNTLQTSHQFINSWQMPRIGNCNFTKGSIYNIYLQSTSHFLFCKENWSTIWADVKYNLPIIH